MIIDGIVDNIARAALVQSGARITKHGIVLPAKTATATVHDSLGLVTTLITPSGHTFVREQHMGQPTRILRV